MDFRIPSRFKKAWNVFTGRDPVKDTEYIGYGNYTRPDINRFSITNEQTIVTSVCNRLALDVSSLNIQHVKLDESGRFKSAMSSGLNNCLTLDANVDQTGRAFVHDAIFSMLDEGCVALVPTYTDRDPEDGSYDILELRVAEILEWYPRHVRVKVYNEETGRKEEVRIEKDSVAIIENPFYAVMNESNSTIKRLNRKLRLLDVLDEKTGNGKLDIIIQLPFMVKNKSKKEWVDNRRKEIEEQLSSSKYGIAYADATEHITQLNRPAESNLMAQIEYLTNMAYSQLNITAGVLDGTANEATMQNYYSRTIEPLATALVDEMKRKFLTKTARTQGQSVEFFRDPFSLVPINNIAEIADKFTRNEIMTSNEFRQAIGMRPSGDPNADMLRNKNINQATGEGAPATYDVNGNLVSQGTPQLGMEGTEEGTNPNQPVANAAFGELVQTIESNLDTLIQGYQEGNMDVNASVLADALKNLISRLGADSLTGDDAEAFNEYLDGIEEDVESIFGVEIDLNGDQEMAQSGITGYYLAHYASPYYDPVKAHEYYMRTRQLKGRRSSSQLSDEGKKVWEYTKSNITAEKKSKIEEKKTERDTKITESRAKATESRTRIAERLKSLNAALTERATSEKARVNSDKETKTKQISEKREAELARIREQQKKKREQIGTKRDADIKQIQADKSLKSDEKKAKIAEIRADSKTQLNKVSETSKTEQAKARADATSQSTAVRTEAKNENARISSETKTEKAVNTANAKSEREQVAANLKTEINNARTAFNDAKAEITETAEKTLDSEYAKIQAEYPKVSKKKSTKK